MKIAISTAKPLLAAALALTLAGCAEYVKRDEFDAAVTQLRQTDESLQQQINTLAQDLRARLADQDTRITALQGRLRVETTTHFAFDDSTLREQDRPLLDDFAAVIREHHPNVLITVEGFTDPAGSASYNKRLGQRRADAVRNHLIDVGGLNAEKVRAVSYGKDPARLVIPGASHDKGEPNRRVALVIDYVDLG
jgi:peptidoglycan-associated lipoprotein